MKKVNIFTLIIIAIIVVIFIWWLLSMNNNMEAPQTPPSPYFGDMKSDFLSFSGDLWMTDNIQRLERDLSNSNYRYRILDSTLSIFYDNRNNNPDKDSMKSHMEVVAASSILEFSLVREKQRNLAIRVTDGVSYRIVHMSSPLI